MNDESPTTDQTGKKSRRGKVTRERIIRVTENLIAQHGPDGFQLQDVTEALGITPPAIYNHFKDRDHLVAEIADRGGARLADQMRAEADEDVLGSLRRNARGFVDFLVENPAHARIILWDMARRGTTRSRGLEAANSEIRERMRAAFDEAAAAGQIRKIRLESYLQHMYIGTAAAVAWADYHIEESETGDPVFTLDPVMVEQLKDEAENLVVRLLAP